MEAGSAPEMVCSGQARWAASMLRHDGTAYFTAMHLNRLHARLPLMTRFAKVRRSLTPFYQVLGHALTTVAIVQRFSKSYALSENTGQQSIWHITTQSVIS